MTNVGSCIFLLVLLISSYPSWGTVTPLDSSYQYDVGLESVSVENTELLHQNHVYDGAPNLHPYCSNSLICNLQEKTLDGSFFAFEVSLLATKGAKGLETRGVKPAPGERTIQGQVDAATQAGNPTIQRGGQDLVRLRSGGHGQAGATATPQNVRNVAPNGRVFTGKGADRAVTPRDIRELHKAQTGQGTSTIRTRSGR